MEKSMIRSALILSVLSSCAAVALAGDSGGISSQQIPVTDGPSIQQALNASRGKTVVLPPGDYTISQAIRISTSNTGLVGPGRIIQTNAQEPVVVVSRADGVQLRNLTLSRPGDTDGSRSGLMADSCRNLVVDNVQVIDNRAASASINLDRCINGRICNCLVRNYSRISVDDR